MLVWPIAANAPSSIEATEMNTAICRHSVAQSPNGSYSTRRVRPMAATLGAAARNAVTGVGAPSYTSGVHMWNGTAASLNARPAAMNTSPIRAPWLIGARRRSAWNTRARTSNDRVPVKP